jgi:hypothetical protein
MLVHTNGNWAIVGPDAHLHRIYLAGKINYEARWRHKLIPDFPRELEADALRSDLVRKCKSAGGAVFWYTGPYFVCCDHGCTHTPGMHGAGYDCMSDWPRNTQSRRNLVHSLNVQRIERSTGLFAFVDELDCYGTISEIGYAAAKGIPVGLAYGPHISVHARAELWFIERFATWFWDALPVQQAFECFLSELSTYRLSHKHTALASTS